MCRHGKHGTQRYIFLHTFFAYLAASEKWGNIYGSKPEVTHGNACARYLGQNSDNIGGAVKTAYNKEVVSATSYITYHLYED